MNFWNVYSLLLLLTTISAHAMENSIILPFKVTFYNKSHKRLGILCRQDNNLLLKNFEVTNRFNRAFISKNPEEHNHITLPEEDCFSIILHDIKSRFPLHITVFDFEEEFPTDKSLTTLNLYKIDTGRRFNIRNKQHSRKSKFQCIMSKALQKIKNQKQG